MRNVMRLIRHPLFSFVSNKQELKAMMNGANKLFSTDGKSGERKFQICVEGNIGSGKTTLIDYFTRNPNVEALAEPVKRWRDVQGISALGYMYQDPSRWGLTFQTYVQLTMLQIHNQPQLKKFKMMERSIFSAKYCFVENLYQGKLMQDLEYIILTEWFDYILQSQNIQLDLIIYLQTSPEISHERIKQRQRPEENLIPFDYLKSLHNLHEDWLINKKFPLSAPVLIVDGNHEKEQMEREYESLPDRISSILGEPITL